jgi:ketosteroid isomerase-like protein
MTDEKPDTATLGRILIDTLGKGWERTHPETILSVFADDAVFHESPVGEPLIGKDALRQYWADTPYHQADVKFSSGEIFVVGPWFSTEIKVTYRRRRTGELVDTRGALFCETNGERITEMRMYWHRTVAREAGYS